MATSNTTFKITPQSFAANSFAGKHVLITGGASGIGLCTAEILLNLGAKLSLLDLNPPPSSSPVHNNPRVHVACGDIRDWVYHRAAFKSAIAANGQLDGVFVNAGIGEGTDVIFTDEFDKDGELKQIDHKVLDIDIRATADTVKLAVHHMKKNNGGKGSGSIVAVASLAGYFGSKGLPLYSAAKHGVVGLMRALKNELSAINMAISVIAPAITVTPLLTNDGTRTLQSEIDKMNKNNVALNKVESVAAATVWLLSQEQKGNGKGILIQADVMTDLEEGLVKNRPYWFGKEMLDHFRSGRSMKEFSKLPAKL